MLCFSKVIIIDIQSWRKQSDSHFILAKRKILIHSIYLNCDNILALFQVDYNVIAI